MASASRGAARGGALLLWSLLVCCWLHAEDQSELDRQISLLQSKSWQARQQAAMALGTLRDKRALGPLIVALKDQHARVRSQVADALGRLLDREAVEPLILALKDADSRVRVEAATSLGCIGDVRAVAPLIDTLKDPDGDVRSVAAWALGKLRDTRAVKPLIEVLEQGSGTTAEVTALIEIGPPAAAALVEVLASKNINAVQLASYALEQIGGAAVSHLTTALRHPKKRVRYAAALALKEIEWRSPNDLQEAYYLVAAEKWTEVVKTGPAALEPLVAVLKDADDDIRVNAVRILGGLGDARATQSLVAAMRDSERSVRSSAAEALKNVNWVPASDTERVVCLIASGRWDEVIGLGPRAIGPLVSALVYAHESAANALDRLGWQHLDNTQKAAYLIALGRWQEVVGLGEPAVGPLIKVVREGWRPMRPLAAEALGEIGDPRAADVLLMALSEGDNSLRESVALALGRIGDRRAVAHLTRIVRDPHDEAAVIVASALALGDLRDERALEPLLFLLTDLRPRVRWAAAWGLSRLGKRDAVTHLEIALRHEQNPVMKTVLLGAMAKLGNQDVLSVLVADLWDKDEGRRKAAFVWLRELGDRRAAELIIRDTTLALREFHPIDDDVIVGLATMGAPAIQALVAALADDDWIVRESAVAISGKLGDKRLVDHLLARLNDKHTYVRKAAAEALGNLGDKRAVEPLKAILSDNSPDVREAISAALRKLETAAR